MPKGVYTRRKGLKRSYRVSPIEDRMRDKILVTPDGCWRWIGFIDKAGYGRINGGRRGSPVLYAHRVAYELHKGAIGERLELDHLCRNRWCCNPDHLEPVTHQTNVLRGIAPAIVLHRSGKCSRGHERNEVNTYCTKGRTVHCRICRREKRSAQAAEVKRKAVSISGD